MKNMDYVLNIYRKTGILPSFGEDGKFSKSFLRKLRRRGITLGEIPDSHTFEYTKETSAGDNKGRIVVEAAHIYTDHSISREHKIGCEVGRFISELFGELGYSVEKWVFIDDIFTPSHNPLGKGFDYDAYIAFLCDNGFQPDNITLESALINDAGELIENLIEKGRVSGRGQKLYLRGNKYNSNSNTILYDRCGPTCSVLDTVYHVRKLESADYAITVLPASFKSEQHNMKRVLKEAASDPKKILNVFINPECEGGAPDTFSEDSIAYIGIVPAVLLHCFDGTLNQAGLNSFIRYCKENVLPYLKEGRYSYKLPFKLGAMTYVC